MKKLKTIKKIYDAHPERHIYTMPMLASQGRISDRKELKFRLLYLIKLGREDGTINENEFDKLENFIHRASHKKRLKIQEYLITNTIRQKEIWKLYDSIDQP